jgi:hypothetical protein
MANGSSVVSLGAVQSPPAQQHLPAVLAALPGRVGIKKPAQKNPPKKTQKTRLKKPTKTHPQVGFLGFF